MMSSQNPTGMPAVGGGTTTDPQRTRFVSQQVHEQSSTPPARPMQLVTSPSTGSQQHRRTRLGPRERIDMLFDPGTFIELNSEGPASRHRLRH
jgi:acetyl-CoA carboxylase carboxyltransferase component